MRPHRLSLTAFGSFPGSETVDFDSLAESGLFLIHGPTGAGKTTVLDALCFALYGQVPGQRNSARSLRCDHAPAGTGPSVTLEVTLRGRLLRIRRSPSWQRPKLRGTGHTEEKAKVIVEERTGAAWHGLTTRADEAGDLVGGLLGMNADQFCQVAMLPQGDFARFLRASGDDRHKLLGRLFTVKTFTQAETWLADHRKRAWRDQQDLRQQVDYAVQRLAEAATDLALPSPSTEDHAAQLASSTGGHSGASPEDAGRETALPGPEDDPVEWAGALLAAAQAAVLTTAERHAEAERAWRSAGARFEEASALAARQRRHAEALTLRRTLDERAEERAELQAILDDAARADRVVPLITAARHRAEAATKAATLAADALTRAHPLLPPPSATPAAGSHAVAGPQVEWLAGLERQRRAESARLSELLTEEARLLVVRRDLGRVETELATLERDDEATTARLAELPHLLQQAETQLARARADAARIPAVEAVRDAAADLIEVDGKLARAAAELDDLAEREAEVAAAEAELPARVAEAAARLDGVRAEAAAVP
ncbi:AAA family ATPase, partial [Nonomuraea ceibae]|uniref:AAA family ATPase n=1 Tax=Nonomuraea ceibae TaxID=1935170 RepID=UPI001C5FAC0B